MLEVEVLAGSRTGTRFRLEGHTTFLVGRSAQAHLRLPEDDDSVSRLHCLIEVNPPACRIVDLGSTNGVRVNGKQVESADLRGGETVQLGETLVRIQLGDLDETVDAPALTTDSLPPVSSMTPEVSAVNDLGSFATIRSPCPLCSGASVADKLPPIQAICATCRNGMASLAQPFPDYRLVRELGHGGFGTVSLGVRLSDGQAVAIKRMRSAGGSPALVRLFLREMDIQCRLNHPNIVALLDRGQGTDGTLFAVLDYIPGRDANAILQAEGPFTIARTLVIADQLLRALAHAHERQLVHRDVKPANLLLSGPSFERAWLTDFGLARVYHASRLSGLTLTGQTRGTVPFMPPEQVTNMRDVSPKADQYSAAATLYTLLTNCYVHDFPQGTGNYRSLRVVIDGRAVPLQSRRPDLPSQLTAAIDRSLQKNPDDRYPDVETFRQELLASAPKPE